MGLSDQEFSHRVTRDGRVLISWRGRQVVVLKGAKAASFVAASENLIGEDLQLLLARFTGNFRRGNERSDTEK